MTINNVGINTIHAMLEIANVCRERNKKGWGEDKVAEFVGENLKSFLDFYQDKSNIDLKDLAEQWYTKEFETVPCPLCESVMVYSPHGDTNSDNDDRVTHAWVCRECPGILLEYYSDKNLEMLRGNL